MIVKKYLQSTFLNITSNHSTPRLRIPDFALHIPLHLPLFATVIVPWFRNLFHSY